MQSIVDKYIGAAIAERRSGPAVLNNVSQQEKTPTQRLSVLSELVDQSQDPLYIGDQLLSFFLPLHNRTPIRISYLFYHMSMTRAVYAKLRAEVLKIGDVALVFEVLKSVKYIQYVIKESSSIRTVNSDIKSSPPRGS